MGAEPGRKPRSAMEVSGNSEKGIAENAIRFMGSIAGRAVHGAVR